RFELEGVRRLVQRDKGPELVEGNSQARGGGADVWLDEMEPAPGDRRSRQQADVVLAEHLASQEADEEPELLVSDRAIDDARQRARGRCEARRADLGDGARWLARLPSR